MGFRTVNEAIVQFLAWCKPRRSKITIDLHRRYLYRFSNHCRRSSLAEVKRLDIENFTTKKHPLESIKCFFRWCCEGGTTLAENPAKGIRVPESGCRARTFRRREAVFMRRLAKMDLRAYLLAIEETGARPGEMRKATMANLRTVDDSEPSDENLSAGRCYFRFDEFKSRTLRKNQKTIRVIPISPRLGRLIVRIRNSVTCEGGPIFATSGRRPWSNDKVQRRVRRLRLRVGRRLKIDPKGIVCYTYRHSLATTLAVHGVTGRLLAEILGHTTERMLARYVHPSTGQMLEVFQAGSGKGVKVRPKKVDEPSASPAPKV